MKRKKAYNVKLGKLIFVVPILIIGALVVYAFIALASPGTLIVRAETQNGASLQVDATVGSRSGVTPWTLSLGQGSYVVNFTAMTWYYPPASHDVAVTPGDTVYAVAVYVPIEKAIQTTNSGFNVTSVAALHGVTPINFTNPSSSPVTLKGSPIGTVLLEPGQSYSYVFSSVGTYNCTILAGGYQVTDEVVTISVA